MADVQTNGHHFKINGANDYYLGNGDIGVVATFAIHIVNDNSLAGATITVKARSSNKAAADAGVAPLAVPYLPYNVNGAAGAGTLVTTGITTNSFILVPATGATIVLSVAGSVTGSASVYCTPFDGAAA